MRSSDRIARLGPIACASLVLAVPLVAGCVGRQRREMIEARDAWRQCENEHPYDAARACAALEAQAKANAARYEDDAQRAWGCGAVDDGPCDPRDRTPGIPR